MKILKSLTVICLVLSVSFNVIQYQKEQDIHENYRKQEQVLKTRIYELEEKEWDYIDENKNLVLDMESYKFIFDFLEDNMFEENTQEVLKSTYSYETSISFGGEVISVPQSGIIYITENSFSFDAKIIKPPTLSNQQVNGLLEWFDISPIHRTIYYPIPDDFVIEDSSIHLEYNNLKVGDRIQIVPTERFKENFKIGSEFIEIHVVDENDYAKGSDYFPTEPMTAYYTFDNSVYEYKYDYYKFEEDFLYVKASAMEYEDQVFYNVSDGAVIYSRITEGDTSPEYVILPKVVLLGLEWKSDIASKVITSLEVVVSTPAGEFNCVEVTTYYSNEEVNRSYYAKGMGLIKESNEHNTNELIRIESRDLN